MAKLKKNIDTFAIYKVATDPDVSQTSRGESSADNATREAHYQITAQKLKILGQDMTAISFSNMSEYMKNFELTKKISQMQTRLNQMLQLILYMKQTFEPLLSSDSVKQVNKRGSRSGDKESGSGY